MPYQSINPATGEPMKSFEELVSEELEAALTRADAAARVWRESPLETRAELLRKVADSLDANAAEHARLMAQEMGKPIVDGEAEAKKCAWVCRHYAENAAKYLEPQHLESDGDESYVAYEPLGPIFAVMPWNYPYWQVFRHAAPALMAGNVILLKHAHSTPECGLAIERIFREVGYPQGAFQTLLISSKQAPGVIADPRVKGVTLTGSNAAGQAVGGAAGRNLKKCVLELGGSDPFIVLEDANLEEAVKVGVTARCLNSGQSCIAAKRFIVHRSRYEEFTQGFVEGMRNMKVGDPLNRETRVGPLARADLRDELHKQVTDSVKAGARVLCGGEIPQGKGFYYPPTVVVDAPNDSPVWCEETFGPVAVIISFDDDREAVRLANDSPFGLGASLWTSDIARAKGIIPRIDAGAVFVNGLVKSDPRLPFGGVKESGFGRELGREGMLEFVNQKTVWIK